ncbi:hypothetical protein HBA55_34985 [Pseudomaricurvus alkylphenolicus]|uniref:hypothetical protein n=1 Tax=Pseudomaricurvus alkylphenolicus TaxID=1306991 RepID=UPI0014223E39|nr:hypothetical protein [Pseudomaricurvus alkylphenolicus]NIB44839.1 hypothetical protein [Pseudomaricurvus alkylphenolicus]
MFAVAYAYLRKFVCISLSLLFGIAAISSVGDGDYAFVAFSGFLSMLLFLVREGEFWWIGDQELRQAAIKVGLKGHWKKLEKWRKAGYEAVDDWYFDEPSESQLSRLSDMSIRLRKGMTKGQASDLIGLGEVPGHESLEVLRFFDWPNDVHSETERRMAMRLLFKEPENLSKWEGECESRERKRLDAPATQMQKEFYRFVGKGVPKGLRFGQAEEFAAVEARRLSESKLEEWDAFVDIWDSLSDRDEAQDCYGVKKVSLPVFKAALKALDEESVAHDVDEMDGWRSGDPQIVADKVIEMNPQMIYIEEN